MNVDILFNVNLFDYNINLEIITAFTGFLFFFSNRPIGIIIGINSLLFHLSNAFLLESRLFFHKVDLLCNILFCIYGLYKTNWLPQSYIIFFLVLIIFIINRYITKNNYMHIMFVQLPLLFCYLKQ